MKHYEIDGFKRITKQAAKKLYNDGKLVYFCPVNLRPGWPYNPQVLIDNSDDSSFEKAVIAFEWYNCINTETGKYTAFYGKEGK